MWFYGSPVGLVFWKNKKKIKKERKKNKKNSDLNRAKPSH